MANESSAGRAPNGTQKLEVTISDYTTLVSEVSGRASFGGSL